MRVNFRKNFWTPDDIEGWLCYDAPNVYGPPTVKAVIGFETRDYKEGDLIDPWTTKVGHYRLSDTVQKIVDAAWDVGIRPTVLKSEMEVPAIKRHLEDMRAIAFFKIGLGKDAKE